LFCKCLVCFLSKVSLDKNLASVTHELTSGAEKEKKVQVIRDVVGVSYQDWETEN
jgi:hypothetical protein